MARPFLDEVYLLAGGDGGGSTASYGRVALDTLFALLGRYHYLVCVAVAGYENEMAKSFFGINPGLKRRFPTTVRFAPLGAPELVQLAAKLLAKKQLTLSADAHECLQLLVQQLVDEHAYFAQTNASGIIRLVTKCLPTARAVSPRPRPPALSQEVDVDDLIDAFARHAEGQFLITREKKEGGGSVFILVPLPPDQCCPSCCPTCVPRVSQPCPSCPSPHRS